jgi:RNA polymerase primary sigma factor
MALAQNGTRPRAISPVHFQPLQVRGSNPNPSGLTARMFKESGPTTRYHCDPDSPWADVRNRPTVVMPTPKLPQTFRGFHAPEQRAVTGDSPLPLVHPRLGEVLARKCGYMPHPCFDEESQAETIIGAMPPRPDQFTPKGKLKKPYKPKAPKGLPPYLAALYEVELLTREQEQHLFRQMNYLLHICQQLQERLKVEQRPHCIRGLVEEFLAYWAAVESVKNQIIRANLRLVVSIAKRRVTFDRTNFFELISDGNVSLIKAVEKFDFSRGNKFSTYATWAIRKNFSGTISKEVERQKRFPTGADATFENAADRREGSDENDDRRANQLRRVISGLLGRLDDRERRIIVGRYGLNGAIEQTLEQVGRELGITKERVRQLESRAEEKLRKWAAEGPLDLEL